MPKKKKVDEPFEEAVLDWHLPGTAIATVYLTDPNVRTALFVALMPCRAREYRVEALIGDSITREDFMNINDFETAFQMHAGDPYVRVAFVNRSSAPLKFELAFIFDGDEVGTQRYEYELDAQADMTDRIDVRLLRS